MRVAACIVGGAVLGGLLAGCASAGLDPAASTWLDRVTTERSDVSPRVGVAAGVTHVGDAASSADGITLAFEDETSIGGVDIRCFGGGTVAVDIRMQTPSQGRGIHRDIPCDEAGHDVRIGENGATVPHVTSLTVAASSPAPTTFYAEILP